MQKFLLFLRTHSSVSPAAHSALHSKVSGIQLKERETLLTPGCRQNSLYFVSSGIIRHYFKSSDDKEWTSQFDAEGEFVLSVESFVLDRPSEKFIEAYTSVDLVKILKTDYLELLDQFPELHAFFNKLLLLKQLADEKRIYYLHALNVHDRYELFMETNPALIGRVQVQHLASYLGMNPDTLSRVRKQLSNGI